jgi:hypothetical protein
MIVVMGLGKPKATEEIVDGWIVKKPKIKKEKKKREAKTKDAGDKPKRQRKKKVAGSADLQLGTGAPDVELPLDSGDPSNGHPAGVAR